MADLDDLKHKTRTAIGRMEEVADGLESLAADACAGHGGPQAGGDFKIRRRAIDEVMRFLRENGPVKASDGPSTAIIVDMVLQAAAGGDRRPAAETETTTEPPAHRPGTDR